MLARRHHKKSHATKSTSCLNACPQATELKCACVVGDHRADRSDPLPPLQDTEERVLIVIERTLYLLYCCMSGARMSMVSRFEAWWFRFALSDANFVRSSLWDFFCSESFRLISSQAQLEIVIQVDIYSSYATILAIAVNKGKAKYMGINGIIIINDVDRADYGR